jgi:hypothetical protein
VSTDAVHKGSHLTVTVHGIRTFGQWQERLERLANAATPGPEIDFINYKYGYFSVIAFIIPFFRWLVVRRFRNELIKLCSDKPRARIDLVGHSFGTHVIAWSIAGLPPKSKIFIHTVILSGSVLRADFPWRDLIGTRVKRVINDCGTKDAVLLLNQFFVLFTGMAGRTGFGGATSNAFRNRYSNFGHSGYFLDDEGKLSDNYMRKHWVPLLIFDHPIAEFDHRKGGALEGIIAVLANNAEPIKLSVYITPFALVSWWIYTLYARAVADESRALAALSRVAIENHRPADAAKLALSAWPETAWWWDNRPQLELSLQTLSQAMAVDPPSLATREMRHDHIRGAILTRDERRILSWSADEQTLRLWDAATGQQIGRTMRHEDWVKGALLTKDERRILSWSDDKTLRLWDAATGQQIGLTMNHEGRVSGALLTKNEKRILSWSEEDGTMRLRDAATGRQIGPTMRHEYVHGVLLTNNEHRILSWSWNGTFRLWDVATGEQIGPAMEQQGGEGARLTSDERRVLSWGDGTLRLWDVATGKQIDAAMKHEDRVLGALLTKDERRILSWSNDGPRQDASLVLS